MYGINDNSYFPLLIKSIILILISFLLQFDNLQIKTYVKLIRK